MSNPSHAEREDIRNGTTFIKRPRQRITLSRDSNGVVISPVSSFRWRDHNAFANALRRAFFRQ